MTGTGTEIETEASDREGGRKELEGVPSPVCFSLYGSLHLIRDCTPDTSLPWLSFPGFWCSHIFLTFFGVNLYFFSLISAKLLIYSPPLFPHPSPVLAFPFPVGCFWSAGWKLWIQWERRSMPGLQESCFCPEESALGGAAPGGHWGPAMPRGSH